MTDTLRVIVEKNDEDYMGICVARMRSGIVDILKMVTGDEAKKLYEMLTNEEVDGCG